MRCYQCEYSGYCSKVIFQDFDECPFPVVKAAAKAHYEKIMAMPNRNMHRGGIKGVDMAVYNFSNIDIVQDKKRISNSSRT